VIDYDPFAPEIRDDPYPTYRELRDSAPAYYLPRFDAWALSRFEDIWNASSNPAFSTARGTAPAQLLTREQPVTPMLNCMDPPEHTRLRAQLSRCFQPAFVTRLESQALLLVEAILDRAALRGALDVVSELGSELAVAMSCLAVGMHLADGPAIAALVQRFFRHEPNTQGVTADGLLALGELQAICADRIRERRRRPHDSADALSALAHFTHSNGRAFGELEAGSHAAMILIGGSETFPKVLANGVLRLWQHADQRELLVRNPTLVASAFDEIVRYDMPTQFLGRRLLADLSLHGETLRVGQSVILLYASANRDDREFERPDDFLVARRPARTLSFGAGTHQCIGRHIAAMEGRVALTALLRRFPNYHVDTAHSTRVQTEFVQGFASLPIELGRAAAVSAAPRR
jgi:hypothetical protein